MTRAFLRLWLIAGSLVALSAPAVAQGINWNITYSGTQWNDNTPIGSTTVGQARRDSIVAATVYLN
jgi:hypothetical protein